MSEFDASRSVAHAALVELTRASVSLRGRRVLHDVTWTVRGGERWIVTGANGSGKSTLLRLVRGDVWPDDDATRSYPFSGAGVLGAREAFAYISPERQERHQRLELGLTVRAVVASGLFDADYLARQLTRDDERFVDELLDRFGLAPQADRPVRTRSHGTTRRVLIARALARRPRALLLDECTSGLDSQARRELLEALENVGPKTAIVHASHRAAHLSANAMRLHLSGGRVVEPRVANRTWALPVAPPARASSTRPALLRLDRADVVLDGAPVLHDLRWELRAGEHWRITGPNGSGKSTLARVIAGTVAVAHGGTIERNGIKPPFLVADLKARIVLLSDEAQTAYDWNATVADVVASGFFASIGLFAALDARQRARVGKLLERFELGGLAGRHLLELSFGERRRALLARACVRDPEIFIADEAAEGLDPGARHAFFELLDAYAAQGTTLVVISHDDERPRAVTNELVLEAGRIAYSGPLAISA